MIIISPFQAVLDPLIAQAGVHPLPVKIVEIAFVSLIALCFIVGVGIALSSIWIPLVAASLAAQSGLLFFLCVGSVLTGAGLMYPAGGIYALAQRHCKKKINNLNQNGTSEINDQIESDPHFKTQQTFFTASKKILSNEYFGLLEKQCETVKGDSSYLSDESDETDETTPLFNN